jgi:steroid delta-isomerase-like uncharacterized protein
MTTITNPTLQRQFDALNGHDIPAFAACYSADASVFDPQYPELLKGRDAVAKDMKDFVAAFPDLHAEIRRTIGGGDTFAYEMTMAGTHEGPMTTPNGDIAPTHRRVEFGGSIIIRLDRDGRIVEERRYYDLAGLLGQLGLLQ